LPKPKHITMKQSLIIILTMILFPPFATIQFFTYGCDNINIGQHHRCFMDESHGRLPEVDKQLQLRPHFIVTMK